MHLCDQISQCGSLHQFPTEICEASYKPLKEAYCRSNHIDSMPQIITGCSRAHSIAVTELEIEAWAAEDQDIIVSVKDVLRPKWKTDQLIVKEETRMFMTLRGKQSIKPIYKIVHLAEAFVIPDLQRHVEHFFAYNICQNASGKKNFSSGQLQAIFKLASGTSGALYKQLVQVLSSWSTWRQLL